MISWCAYCQRLVGEVPPLSSAEVTHGICESCVSRLKAGEPLVALYRDRVQFYRELFSAGMRGDQRTCVAMIRHSREAGFGREELLVGLLQPALVGIGALWEQGRVTVSDEQRFTAWCNSMLDQLAEPPSGAPLDLLLLQAPGNLHSIGLRVAELVLRGRGLRCRAVLDPRSAPEIMALCAEYQPAWIGFSCSLPHMVHAALDLHASLIASGYRGRTLLAGRAIREHPETWRDSPVVLCATLADALGTVRPATSPSIHA